MPRFFIDKDQISDSALFIDGDDSRHIARSLRMAVGDELTVSDKNGQEYLCVLTKIRDDRCDADIISVRSSDTEPKCRITLFMAYPKGDKLETVIQKAVELGAHEIVPFESSRCVKRPKADKASEKRARLARIAEEAAKQCGRGCLPVISLPIKYEDVLARAKEYDLPLFCYEGSNTLSLKSVLEKHDMPKSIAVVVGSEGGFSEDEAKNAVTAGFISVGLGPRILRCETAPDYALSCISYRYEL